MNNNMLKQQLTFYVVENCIGLISIENTNTENLQKSNFTITILSNNTVFHKLTFDYHLTLINYTVSGDVSMLTVPIDINNILQTAKTIRRANNLK